MIAPEMVRPVIEHRDEQRIDPCPPEVMRPEDETYHTWMEAISEGWCPPSALDGQQHRLEPFVIPETGEVLLHCAHGTWFRLVYHEEEA